MSNKRIQTKTKHSFLLRRKLVPHDHKETEFTLYRA